MTVNDVDVYRGREISSSELGEDSYTMKRQRVVSHGRYRQRAGAKFSPRRIRSDDGDDGVVIGVWIHNGEQGLF